MSSVVPVFFNEVSNSSKISLTEAVLDFYWQQAMVEELYALNTNTWDLVSLPYGKSTISSHWVYKIKTNFDGSVE